jgi:hypothetical protein
MSEMPLPPDLRDALLKRIDDLGNTVFIVCIGVAGTSVGVAATSRDTFDQVIAALIGFGAAVAGILAVPDVALSASNERIGHERYIRRRQASVQAAAIFLGTLIFAGGGYAALRAIGVSREFAASVATAGVIVVLGVTLCVGDRFWPIRPRQSA